jgi:four helix bundle protein
VNGELRKGGKQADNSKFDIPNSQFKRDLPDRTFEFARRIVKLCRELDQKPGVSRTMANQLLRSGTSVGANVEEGQAAQSRADFLNKLSIACKEARETHYWLRLLAATEIVGENRLNGLLDEANQITAILTAITKNTRVNTEV